MADNKLTQRLIAAGASPDRAKTFAEQAIAQKQSEIAAKTKVTKPADRIDVPIPKVLPKVPGVPTGVKRQGRPKNIEDAFDPQLAALSAATFPYAFRPPVFGEPNYDSYVNLVLGPQRITDLKNAAYRNEAPDYTKAVMSLQGIGDYNSLTTPEQKIVWRITSGEPYSKIYQDLITDTSVAGVFNEAQIGDMINKFINQKNKAEETASKAFAAAMLNDPYYKVGLPDPKLQWGKGTIINAGTIDFTKNYDADQYMKLVTQNRPEGNLGPIASAAYGTDFSRQQDAIFNALVKSGSTPFSDEVNRREYLKKKQLGQ